MISEKEKSEPSAETPLPNSRKVYVAGQLHPDIRVPFREISLAPTKTMSGEIEVNEPVRVYDTSGPWGDAAVAPDVNDGLAPLRREWILRRGEVETVDGRAVTPQDNGYLSDLHAASANGRNGNPKAQSPNPKFARRPLR
ncbi:MAG TPA: phosphomethylpyrimidine synthase, partial [Chthoniobacterales bacterium]|nr:phosphomethylpyrimidine synthase [Chthoniobacterales bacterium]